MPSPNMALTLLAAWVSGHNPGMAPLAWAACIAGGGFLMWRFAGKVLSTVLGLAFVAAAVLVAARMVGVG